MGRISYLHILVQVFDHFLMRVYKEKKSNLKRIEQRSLNTNLYKLIQARKKSKINFVKRKVCCI